MATACDGITNASGAMDYNSIYKFKYVYGVKTATDDSGVEYFKLSDLKANQGKAQGTQNNPLQAWAPKDEITGNPVDPWSTDQIYLDTRIFGEYNSSEDTYYWSGKSIAMSNGKSEGTRRVPLIDVASTDYTDFEQYEGEQGYLALSQIPITSSAFPASEKYSKSTKAYLVHDDYSAGLKFCVHDTNPMWANPGTTYLFSSLAS